MSKEQFAMLQTFAAMLSQQKPLVEMSEEYDLGLIEED